MADFNYFAEDEQTIQEEFKHSRDRAFSFIVKLFVRLQLTPDDVSLCGMLALIPFAYLVIAFPDPLMIAISCVFLLIHVALDGIDGPLARHCHSEGPSGAFVDMCCDHGGMVIVTWVLSLAGVIDGTVGNVYVFLYTMAVVFIIWLNALGQPFKFVFRSKYLFYVLIFVYGLAGWDILNISLLAFSAANGWLCALGFIRVKRILAQA